MVNPFLRRAGLAVACAGLLLASAHADAEIQPDDVDAGRIVLTHPDMPARGTTKEQVEADLGEPPNRVPPVGDPPISSWVYDEFIIYFEHDRVIHSVIPGGERQARGAD